MDYREYFDEKIGASKHYVIGKFSYKLTM